MGNSNKSATWHIVNRCIDGLRQHRRMPLIPSASCNIYYENDHSQETPNYDCAAFDRFVPSPLGSFLASVSNFIHAYRNDLTAWATLAVAAFTGTLWWSTNRLWISAEHQLAELRESSELARKEFISTHRPKIIVRDIELAELETGRMLACVLHCVNVGDTEAEGMVITSNVLLIDPKALLIDRIPIPRQSNLTPESLRWTPPMGPLWPAA
jgi:hypothetical protein